MVRVTAESRDDNTYIFKTSNLQELRSLISKEVFDVFCCCFVHTDRILSLIDFKVLSQTNHSHDSVISQRNDLNIVWLFVGVIKELQIGLAKLRGSLKKKGIWDQNSWNKRLKQVEEWGQSEDVSNVRNHVAFHVIPARMTTGLDSIADPEVVLFRSDSFRDTDSTCEVATNALIQGIQLDSQEGKATLKGIQLEKLIEDLVTFMDIQEAVVEEFLRVLKCYGIEPVRMNIKGKKVFVTQDD